MDDTVKTQIDSHTAQAIEASPYEDFREAYRERLRWLKDADPQAFGQALSYYNETLVPKIGDGQPVLEAWLRYGRQLGELSGAGTLYAIDASGRAMALDDVQASGDLLLHLPEQTSIPALPLAIPRDLSTHQKATLDLLVRRKLALE
jgi:hypothetical protein